MKRPIPSCSSPGTVRSSRWVAERTLYVQPAGVLHGAKLTAPDLRGGAALVIAALAAEGTSRVRETGFIDRGYADFARKLGQLGAQITREMRPGA